MILNTRPLAFDLDGTLIDSAPDLADSLDILLSEINRKPLGLLAVKNLVGEGAVAMIEKGLKATGGLGKHDMHKLRARFLEIYYSRMTYKTKLFPGCIETLELLKKTNHVLDLVTNKPEYMALPILEKLNIKKYFANVSGGDTYSERKPSAKHLINTFKDIGIDHSNAILIGDSITDIKCAKNTNIPIILVSYGYLNQNIDEVLADKIIDTLKELPRAIKSLNNIY